MTLLGERVGSGQGVMWVLGSREGLLTGARISPLLTGCSTNFDCLSSDGWVCEALASIHWGGGGPSGRDPSGLLADVCLNGFKKTDACLSRSNTYVCLNRCACIGHTLMVA